MFIMIVLYLFSLFFFRLDKFKIIDYEKVIITPSSDGNGAYVMW